MGLLVVNHKQEGVLSHLPMKSYQPPTTTIQSSAATEVLGPKGLQIALFVVCHVGNLEQRFAGSR